LQYIESSVIGLRSAVFTLARPETPLRFAVFPMVHVAEPDFLSEDYRYRPGNAMWLTVARAPD
jgi:hypothetical protein